MKQVSVVYNGFCGRNGAHYYHMRSMAHLLRDLTAEFDQVYFFVGYLLPSDVGYNSAHEESLSIPRVELCPIRGNSANTPSFTFFRNYIAAMLQLARFIWRSDYVVVFLPSFLSVVACLLALAMRKKLGVYIGGNWGEESKYRTRNLARLIAYPINRFLIDPCVYWIARRSRFVITPGYDLYSKLGSINGRTHLPVPMINIQRSDLIERVDTCQEPTITLLFVGALRYTKGVMELLEAISRMRQNHTFGDRLQVWFVGTGEADVALQQRAEALGITQQVRLFGHVTNGLQLHELYRRADIFVLPTFSEGFPRVLYEAMTFGLPIITTSVGGIPYFLKHATHAYLVPPRSVDALEEAITTLITDATLRQDMIRHARALMLEEIFPRIERQISLAHQIGKLFSTSDASYVSAPS